MYSELNELYPAFSGSQCLNWNLCWVGFRDEQPDLYATVKDNATIPNVDI